MHGSTFPSPHYIVHKQADNESALRMVKLEQSEVALAEQRIIYKHFFIQLLLFTRTKRLE